MGRRRRRSVGVLTASYNTRELTALLLWSLRRVLVQRPASVLVVDNASSDGSREMLSAAEEAGICSLLCNQSNVGHGPALNQGVELLCASDQLDWIWILDSDCVVARPDAIEAVEGSVGERDPVLVGESHRDRWLGRSRFDLYSLMLDARQLRDANLPGFNAGGDPPIDLLDAAEERGLVTAEFPFAADGYVIHRGRGSLAGVAERKEEDHPLYEWARGHHEPHYGGVDGAESRYRDLVTRFRAEAGTDVASFVAALT